MRIHADLTGQVSQLAGSSLTLHGRFDCGLLLRRMETQGLGMDNVFVIIYLPIIYVYDMMGFIKVRITHQVCERPWQSALAAVLFNMWPGAKNLAEPETENSSVFSLMKLCMVVV